MTLFTENKYRCVSKYELSILCGVSMSTLKEWMNHRYFDELKKIGYCKDQKLLLPAQVQFLIEKLIIVED
jgi:hypothetical protein